MSTNRTSKLNGEPISFEVASVFFNFTGSRFFNYNNVHPDKEIRVKNLLNPLYGYKCDFIKVLNPLYAELYAAF